jgi:23S rRNA (guanine745-N1)-methyltransferase
MLICPVCGSALAKGQGSLRCEKGHSFDLAKEGYVNLLRTNKSGDLIGDDKLSARSRRDFLNKGYYAALKDELCRIFADKQGNVLDICCGEGYYTAALGNNEDLCVFGFDISREMVRLAAKRGNGTYFVANMASIPLAAGSMDYCVHLFAPFNENSFGNALKPGGMLYTVIPGRYHLWGLKQALYETPYENDEQLPQTALLRLKDTWKVSAEIDLASQEDIQAVFRMTPYYFHTSERDKQKLQQLTCLRTRVEFVIAAYEKPEELTND